MWYIPRPADVTKALTLPERGTNASLTASRSAALELALLTSQTVLPFHSSRLGTEIASSSHTNVRNYPPSIQRR